jgi:DNA-binding PadR family transcriptional regulator
MAEADAEKRADALIEQIYEIMENGEKWLRQRIAFCERAA